LRKFTRVDFESATNIFAGQYAFTFKTPEVERYIVENVPSRRISEIVITGNLIDYKYTRAYYRFRRTWTQTATATIKISNVDCPRAE